MALQFVDVPFPQTLPFQTQKCILDFRLHLGKWPHVTGTKFLNEEDETSFRSIDHPAMRARFELERFIEQLRAKGLFVLFHPAPQPAVGLLRAIRVNGSEFRK